MRLRMKVWTSPEGNRFLMPAAFVDVTRSTKEGTLRMKAYAMNDDDTKVIELSGKEWDSLPFFFFKEDGECKMEERPKRPFDIISNAG